MTSTSRPPGARGGARVAALLLALCPLLAACSPTEPEGDRIVRSFDLVETSRGWTAGFADYDPDELLQVDPEAGRAPLPDGLEVEGDAFRIAGTNVSDDLFMFLKHRVDDLEPGREYRTGFEVRIATSAPSGCAGIGGPPGEAVTLKVGITTIEPRVVGSAGDDPLLRMNVDKGNQASGGADALVLGDIASGDTDCDDPEWRTKTLRSDSRLTATADSAGVLWLLVGTDSGFEGRTELFYLGVEAELEPL